MKVLVTGGSGYFGSLLIKKLYNAGYRVGSLDINKPDNLNDDIEFFQIDIRDKKGLINATKGFDIIFHNVAQVPLAKNKTLFQEVNINGTKNICEATIENKIKKLVYTSSSAIYGIPKKNPVDENTLPSPQEEYGAAKYEGEKICEQYSGSELSVSIIRPRTILGHGRLGIFSILFSWVKEGINIPVLNNGENIYQFIHADDLADALILSSKSNQPISFYNIGSEGFSTMRETLTSLCKYADSGSKVYSLPLRPIEIIMNFTSYVGISPLGPYHSLMYGRSLYFDINKAKNELGFKPKYDSNKMLMESYDWYVKHIYGKNFLEKNTSEHRKPVKELALSSVRLLSRFL